MSRTRTLSHNLPLLRITISATSAAAHVPYIRSKIRQAHKLVHPRLSELSIALVSDRIMSNLHKRFMNIAGPTDVLTFPLEQDKRGHVLSGEVVVCVPEARRRARELGTELKNELLLYALHGMLHLAGMDDRTDREYRRMHRLEDSILRRIGVGPLFHLNPSANPNLKTTRRRSKPPQKGRRAR